MTQRKEARYRRAVERNLRNAELHEQRRREMLFSRGPLLGMSISDAAHRLGIRQQDAYAPGQLAHLEIRNRLINLTK